MSRWRDPERLFLIIGMAFDAATWAFYVAAIVWWTVDLGFGPLQLVLLGTVLEITSLVSEVPTGVVADRYSRKWSVVIAYVIMGGSMMLSVVSLDYWVMLVAQALFGLGWTFRSGADVAWFTDESIALGQHNVDPTPVIVRRHRLGMVAGSISILAAMAVGQWSLRGLIAIAGASMLAVAGFLAVSMTDHHRVGNDEDEHSAGSILRDGFAATRESSSLRVLVIVMLLLGLGAEALDRLGFKQFLDEGDFGGDSLVYTGALFLILAAAGVAVIAVAERSLALGRDIRLLAVVLLAVSALGAFIAAVAPALGVALGLALQDPCREALDPVSSAWANQHAPAQSRATVLSFVSQSHAIGNAAGGLLLASLAELAGVRWAILVSAGLWAVATVAASQARPR